MAETRKLAAILAADVVGYSKLAGSDEERTLARLRALRSDLIDPTIAVHNGRIVKRTGDGVLIEFRSVVDAVRCAIEMQNGMIERNAGLPPERRIEFRVGIHLGDVVEESDGDLMGDSVNIAARSKLPPSRGSSLFAKTIATALDRTSLSQVILDGFFARTALDDLPRETRRTGLQEFGLPYASDPVISKHLARFLTRSLQNVQASDKLGALVGSRAGGPALMPTAELFNGGVFKAGHLTSAQKRDLISKVLKARPEVSNATVAKQTMADDKTVAKVRRKLEATSEIPRLEKTTGRDGRSRPATTSRAPSQKAGGIAGRTVTAEVDPAASAERRKQEYTADESEREAMTAKDATLREFDGHVLRLAQIINRAEPERFARTSVDVDKLLQLSRFLAEVAGQQPQCADGHSAA